MGIAIDTTSYNGTHLTYARISHIKVDYQTRSTTVAMSGYQSKGAINGVYPVAIENKTFVMPEVTPENIVAFAYNSLSEANPGIDFTEV